MTHIPRYNMSDLAGLELYDHHNDPQENFNIAAEKHYIDIIQRCFIIITKYFK